MGRHLKTTRAVSTVGSPLFKRSFRLLASLKIAIPLLIVLIATTIVVSLFPTPDLFWSRWYLGLLGLLGISLLFITIQHAPLILKRKGRNAMIGVITTHLGILVLIVGVIYGGYTGIRHEIKLIEGEATVIPDLPFVIQLDELHIEEYAKEDFPGGNLEGLPKKIQDSHITLLKGGRSWLQATAAPGKPIRADGFTLLPSITAVGWYLDLILIDPRGREKTVPVPPWEPPVISLGQRQVMTHGKMPGENPEIEIFTREGEELVSLGTARKGESLLLDGYRISVGPVRRYTGMQVYNRPQEPILVLGSVLMFLGLVWHFYFRHRDRRREGKSDA